MNQIKNQNNQVRRSTTANRKTKGGNKKLDKRRKGRVGRGRKKKHSKGNKNKDKGSVNVIGKGKGKGRGGNRNKGKGSCKVKEKDNMRRSMKEEKEKGLERKKNTGKVCIQGSRKWTISLLMTK